MGLNETNLQLYQFSICVQHYFECTRQTVRSQLLFALLSVFVFTSYSREDTQSWCTPPFRNSVLPKNISDPSISHHGANMVNNNFSKRGAPKKYW